MNAVNTHLGVVLIGRNEGERLHRCLESVRDSGATIIYVDSGSTDGSVEMARSLGAEVVELDMSSPFSAARARNAGFARLTAVMGDVQYVQFVDGDCELAPEWLQRASFTLHVRPEVAAVCGRLRERFPDASIYNRLCDIEWDGEPGEVGSCGGIAMYRAACLRAVDGFDPTIPAGEEPELCLRLRCRGWTVVRVADEMGWHDAAMTRFGQWWKRQVRTGYGGLDVAVRFGLDVFRKQVRSAWAWGFGWPAAMLGTGLAAWATGGRVDVALVAVLLVGLAVPIQAARIALRMRRFDMPRRVAMAYGVLTMVGKWAQLQGHLRYCWSRARGRLPQLIEYKELAACAGETTIRGQGVQ